MALEADVAAHSLRLGAAGEARDPEVAAGRFEIQPTAGGKVAGQIAAGGFNRQPLQVETVVQRHVAVDSGHLDKFPTAPGQIELHVGGGQAPEKEEGRAGGLALADRQDSLIGDLHFQLVHVALQPDAVVCSIQQVNGHITVDRLDVHPPQALRGNGAA